FPLPIIRPSMALPVILCVVGYGGLIEVIQPIFGRTADFADLLADAAGAATGVISGLLFRRFLLPDFVR
ncbi:MAG: VanZ family protein, partial [Rhodobacterales bacterium]